MYVCVCACVFACSYVRSFEMCAVCVAYVESSIPVAVVVRNVTYVESSIPVAVVVRNVTSAMFVRWPISRSYRCHDVPGC